MNRFKMRSSSQKGRTVLVNSLEEKSIHINSASAWLILICAWSFYLYEFMLRISPSVMTDQLMQSFSIAACALGTLSSFYYIGYVPLQIPCGVIVDYAGPRITVTLSALICVFGTILFATTENLYIAQSGRFLIGCGSACAYIACLKISSVWFDPSKFALIAGTGQMISVLGGSIGNKPIANLVNNVGWQQTMLYAAGIGIIIAICSWMIIRNKPSDIKREKTHINEHITEGLFTIIKNPQNIRIAIYGFLMNIIITTFAELWGIPFIMSAYNISNDSASFGTTALLFGFAIGSVSSAFIADFFKSYNKVMKVAAMGSSIFLFIAIWVPISYNLMVVMLLLCGFCGGMQILYFTAAAFHAPATATATAVGFTNAFVTGSGIIFQPLLGKVLEFFWDGSLKNGCIPVYSIQAYQYALSTILLCSLAGFFIMFFVKETYQPKN